MANLLLSFCFVWRLKTL